LRLAFLFNLNLRFLFLSVLLNITKKLFKFKLKKALAAATIKFKPIFLNQLQIFAAIFAEENPLLIAAL